MNLLDLQPRAAAPARPKRVLVLALTFATATSVVAACGFRTQVSSVTEIAGGCVKASSDELTVDVDFSACLSSSCDTLLEATCTLAEADGIVTVSGEASIESQVGGACTSDCGSVAASCTIDLPPGDYVVQIGASELMVTHPVAADAGDCVF